LKRIHTFQAVFLYENTDFGVVHAFVQVVDGVEFGLHIEQLGLLLPQLRFLFFRFL